VINKDAIMNRFKFIGSPNPDNDPVFYFPASSQDMRPEIYMKVQNNK